VKVRVTKVSAVKVRVTKVSAVKVRVTKVSEVKVSAVVSVNNLAVFVVYFDHFTFPSSMLQLIGCKA
jgi:hypothetical protein